MLPDLGGILVLFETVTVTVLEELELVGLAVTHEGLLIIDQPLLQLPSRLTLKLYDPPPDGTVEGMVLLVMDNAQEPCTFTVTYFVLG